MIMEGKLNELVSHWQISLSAEALNLAQLLRPAAEDRPSLRNILAHPWMTPVKKNHKMELRSMYSHEGHAVVTASI
jgi:hypothetical protein